MTAERVMSLLYLASVATAGMLGVRLTRLRHGNPVAWALLLTMGAVGVWTSGSLLMLVAPDRTLWCLGVVVADAGASVAATTLAMLALVLWMQAVPPRGALAAMTLEPLAFTVYTAVHMTRPGASRTTIVDEMSRWALTVDHVRLAHLAYMNAISVAGLVLLFGAGLRARGLFRRQIVLLAGSATVPVVVSVALTVTSRGTSVINVTPLVLIGTLTVTSYAVTRHRLASVTPVARALVLEHVTDAVLVLDRHGVLLDANPAGLALLPPAEGGATAQLGRPLSELLAWDLDTVLARGGALRLDGEGRPLEADADVCEDVGEGAVAVSPVTGRLPVHLMLQRTELRDKRGRSLGWVVVGHDETLACHDAQQIKATNARLGAQVRVAEQLRRQLIEQAARDELTGLYNRRQLLADLDHALATARLYDDGVALVMIDIDRFKDVNDTYGHPAGDAVIRSVGRVLAAEARAGETAARYGGEEFVLLMPRVSLVEAVARAEAVRRRCESEPVPLPEGQLVTATISAGVSWTTPPGGGEALLRTADEALYAAKRGGRNQTRAAGSALPS